VIVSEPAVAALAASSAAGARQEPSIVLKPVSHPELGDLRVDGDLFAIGRTETPFASYRPEIVAGLSRRQARIFSANGAAYIADLESKNGTTVNGTVVREKPRRLRHGDEIRFGPDLAYRVHLGLRPAAPARSAILVGLTLHPERGDVGLTAVALSRFPFMISKLNEMFARHQDAYPHQVNYISRRHAHIFVKDGTPFIEDLDSTNGTFVNGSRLDEHAVPLANGDVVRFGGSHFAYRIELRKVPEVESTITVVPLRRPAEQPVDSEKTTFVVSAASFLDIFCVDQAARSEDEINDEDASAPVAAAAPAADAGRSRGKAAVLAATLIEAFAGGDRGWTRRALGWAGALAAVAAIAGGWLYFDGASEREVKDAFARGDHARAAAAAQRHLARHPDSPEIRSLGGQALLKARVPAWLGLLQAGDFDQAAALLAGMKQAGGANGELQSLLAELEWMGELQRFVVGRGGVDAPVRIYADEAPIRRLLKAWNDDTQRHQRAFATISSYVPEFKDAYAEALSSLRRLQNDDSVYLAAIERLKTAIQAELDRDTPVALEGVLKEYAEKYPRLGGLDGLRGDLRQYLELEKEVRARRLGRLVGLLGDARFATPPFEAKFRSVVSADRFPPPALVRDYEGVSKAWRQGDAKQAFAGLQSMAAGTAAGPWAGAVAKELAQKKAILDQYAALQGVRGAPGYEERLLAFYGSLDADEDGHFVRAVEADVGVYRDRALARARSALERAEALLRQYRDAGAIDGRQRLKAELAGEFRAQAQLLAEAHEAARDGARTYAQLKTALPARWARTPDEIRTELEAQRRALADLRHVLEPALYRARLAALGGSER
jgi:pSer/pThr/pTyr-binding forkhead associated (FHA) protein